MKRYIEVVSIAAVAFALGWFMRGDLIYGAYYKDVVASVPIMQCNGKSC